MVMEKITGKKVEQVLKEEVMEPMGLYHTFFSKNDSLQRMVANGHLIGCPPTTICRNLPAWLTPCIRKPKYLQGSCFICLNKKD